MGTHVTIENFKGIGAPVAIELRRITLLFGPNSAGKSSLLHSLGFLAQTLDDYRPPDRMLRLGGMNLDIGSREHYTFMGRKDKATSFRFTFRWDHSLMLDTLGLSSRWSNATFVAEVLVGPSLTVRLHDSDGLAIEFDGQGTPTLHWHPLASQLVSSVVAEMLGIESAKSSETKKWMPYVNHILALQLGLRSPSPEAMLGVPWWPATPSSLLLLVSAHESKQSRHLMALFQAMLRHARLVGGSDHFGHLDLLAMLLDSEGPDGPDPGSWEGDAWQEFVGFYDESPEGKEHGPITAEVKNAIRYELPESLGAALLALRTKLLGMLDFVTSTWRQLTYIGPLRVIPGRSGVGLTSSQGLEYTGETDWQWLVRQPEAIARVNQWLGRDFLDTDLELKVKRLFTESDITWMVRESHNDKKTPIGTLLSRLTPVSSEVVLYDGRRKREVNIADVGVGIAQVLPVLTRGLTTGGFHVIEQPELHVHPRLQAELADVFIASSKGPKVSSYSPLADGTAFLLETHSEHLILRLLRRIRETSEGRNPESLSLAPGDVAVYYLSQGPNGTEVTPIELTLKGEFASPWPEGFFPERFKEFL